jgi:hypothetical protein
VWEQSKRKEKKWQRKDESSVKNFDLSTGTAIEKE